MKVKLDTIVPAVEAALAASPSALRAAKGAVASRFLAVGTPRSIGLIADPADAELALAAHRVFFAPTEIRTAIPEAFACDIVVVARDVAIDPAWIRRGTHLDLWTGALPPLAGAKLVLDTPAPGIWATLHELAAGIKDGRELDEITCYQCQI
jgi:hypothetical protein